MITLVIASFFEVRCATRLLPGGGGCPLSPWSELCPNGKEDRQERSLPSERESAGETYASMGISLVTCWFTQL